MSIIKEFDNMSEMERWIVCVTDPSLIDKVLSNEKEDKLDVFFSINGVEIPFDNVAKRLEEAWLEEVEREVKKRMGQHQELLDIMEDIKVMSFDLSEKISEAIRDGRQE